MIRKEPKKIARRAREGALTREKVFEIYRRLNETDDTMKEIAKDYAVSAIAIGKLNNGTLYPDYYAEWKELYGR